MHLAVFGAGVCLAGLLWLPAAHAEPAMPRASELSLMAPASFSDVRELHDLESRLRLPLEQLLQRLAKQTLPPGQSVAIELTDVDLAGEIEPMGPSMQPTRVLRSSTWPRIKLRFSLRDAEGRALRSGEAALSDLSYLQRPEARLPDSPLPYERAMFTAWFLREFAAAPH